MSTVQAGDLAAELEAFCASLTRDPDFDAEELKAFDTADLFILQTAADAIREAGAGRVVTIGDTHGALTLGALTISGATPGAVGVRSYQDPLLGERALEQNAMRHGMREGYEARPLGEELLAGATVVLVQLPRGLEALDEIAWNIATYADPAVRVFAGGRVKHMTRTQNEVLGRYFDDVSAGLGWRKSRVLSARAPKHGLGASPFPKWGSDAGIGFKLAAFGATFGGTKLDHGSRMLLETLGSGNNGWPRAAKHVLDIGCGSGVLAVSAALALPLATVVASDQSDAAVRSTALTAQEAGVAERVAIHRADGAGAVAPGWADLVLLNPPFHTGATVHSGVGHRLIMEAARALKPSGELRLVFNSHLAYRPLLERSVGEVTQLARDATFTVLKVTKR